MTDTDILQRVARAIAYAESGSKSEWWQHKMPEARAAIAAMRKPAEAMLRAGSAHLLLQLLEDKPPTLHTAGHMWQAMINAALGSADET